jgi:predicted ATPase
MKAVDVPQADSLSRIRELVQTVQFGATDTARLQKVMTLHPRHVGYHLHAARVLGWLCKDDEEWAVAPLGAELVKTAPGSQEERAIYRKSIEASEYLQKIAGNLLADEEPEQDLLSLKIQEVAGIAPATARRRASTLLRWRTQSLPTRLRRFEDLYMSDDDVDQGSLRISAIHVERYGLLRSVRVEMGDRPVFIGDNATGKSTFFDVLAFVHDVLHDGVTAAISKRAGQLDDLIWFGEGDGFGFAIEFLLPKVVRYDHARARYELEIGRLDDGVVGVRKEALYLSPREIPPQTAIHGTTPRGWRKALGLGANGQARYSSEHPSSRKTTTAPVGNDVSALSQLPDDAERFPAARRIRAMLGTGIRVLNLDTQQLCAPCSVEGDTHLTDDGAGFGRVVRALEQGPKDRLTEWKAHVREVVPSLVDIATREVDGQVTILAELRGGTQIPVSRLASGAVRAMAFASLAYQDAPDTAFVLEAPENGMHPRAIEPLVEAISGGGGAQVFITTYSPLWVSAVPTERLRCFVRESGALKVIPGMQIELLESNDDVAMPIIFSAGII